MKPCTTLTTTLMLCLLGSTTAQAASAILPITATVIQCGSRQDLSDDPRCLVFVEPAGDTEPDTQVPTVTNEIIWIGDKPDAYVETVNNE